MNIPKLNLPKSDDYTTNMAVEPIHSQQLKIEDQGVIVFVNANVADINAIQAQIAQTGEFALPAGSVQRGYDRVLIGGGRYEIESDSGTLDRIAKERQSFRLPAKFKAPSDMPKIVDKGHEGGSMKTNASGLPLLIPPRL